MAATTTSPRRTTSVATSTTNLTTGIVTTDQCRRLQLRQRDTTRADVFFQDEIERFQRPAHDHAGRALRDLSARSAADPVLRAGSRQGAESSHERATAVSRSDHSSLGRALFAVCSLRRRLQDADGAAALSRRCRAPSPTGHDLIPNPDLKPEVGPKLRDRVCAARCPGGFFSVSLFKRDYTDFIQNFVPHSTVSAFSGLPDLTYANISKVNLWGARSPANIISTTSGARLSPPARSTGHAAGHLPAQ